MTKFGIPAVFDFDFPDERHVAVLAFGRKDGVATGEPFMKYIPFESAQDALDWMQKNRDFGYLQFKLIVAEPVYVKTVTMLQNSAGLQVE